LAGLELREVWIGTPADADADQARGAYPEFFADLDALVQDLLAESGFDDEIGRAHV